MSGNQNANSEAKNVLVVGSWAKEQITIENLLRDPGVQAFAYMDTINPAIIELTHGYRIGELGDVGKIVNYAKEQGIDLVLVTTAKPLSVGLGKLLLYAAEQEAKERGCELVEAMIDPENVASQRLFESVDYRNVSSQEGETVSVEWNVAVKDYYSPGRHFMVYQKELA